MSDLNGVPQSSQAHAGHNVEMTPQTPSNPFQAAGQVYDNRENETPEPDFENAEDDPEDDGSSSTESANTSRLDQYSSQDAEDLDADEASQSPHRNSNQPEGIDDENISAPLGLFDWEDLNQRFELKMREKRQEEQSILQEMQRLTEYYNIWARAGPDQDQERASKRLRTRIAYVQNKEMQLEQKRDHHAHVVQAFQSALQLLRGL